MLLNVSQQIKRLYSHHRSQKSLDARQKMVGLYPNIKSDLEPKKNITETRVDESGKMQKSKKIRLASGEMEDKKEVWRKHMQSLFPVENYHKTALEISPYLYNEQSHSDLAWAATTVRYLILT